MLSAAELALGTRIDAITRDDVREELWERRTLVKTWAQRGTLHLLPAHELPLWMAALNVSRYWEEKPWRDKQGLSARDVDAVLTAIAEALAGRALLRDELADEVAARAGAQVRMKLLSGWGDLLAPATRLGLLCHGPSRGNNVTFVRADEWIGGWREHHPHEALAEIFRRFLRAYGPARVGDFERWSGVVLPEEVLRAVDVEEVVVESRRALVLVGEAGPREELPPTAPPVRLLPKYDCYLLGSYPRERVVPKEAAARLRAHPRGRFEVAAGHWTLLVGGVVAGMWERRNGIVRVEPFVDLSSAQIAELEVEAARIGRFLGVDTELSVGPLA